MPENTNPWQRLTAHEEIWPQAFEAAEREEIIDRLTLGEIAIPYTGSQESPALRIYRVGEKKYLVPHRHQSLVDFFLRRPGDAAGSTQEDALNLLAQGKHLLLTGGPGTGKSFTITQFVEKLRPMNGRPPRIAIAAPTGKAAARFQNLTGAQHALVDCSTLHRLLGLARDERRFYRDAANPLACDILIVDESSMLDLGLFAALIRALPQNAQLLLAGDLDQLPAVDGLPIDRAIRFLKEAGLIAHVHLTQVQRFAPEKAAAYRRIAEHGLRALEEPAVTAVVQHRRLITTLALGEMVDRYAREHICVQNHRNLRRSFLGLKAEVYPPKDLIETALALLKQQVILTERREGILGSNTLNRRIAAEVARVTKSQNRTLEPVMNIINNYELQIYNGDVGFIWETPHARHAIFSTPQGGHRILPLLQLPGLETAYAMTIHKSQGSEYEDVFVVCGNNSQNDNRLLYTAVTRAKNKATILEVVK